MNDESDDFLDLFENGVSYIEGGRTASGFFTVENIVYEPKLYRASGVKRIHLERTEPKLTHLDRRYVFMFDVGMNIFIWTGKLAKGVTRTKTRLIAEKINKNERKNKAEILMESQGAESSEFWKALGESPTPHIGECVPDDFEPAEPRMYKVGLGMGYLELPQVEIPHNVLTQKLLDSKNVFILDCKSDLFVWIGKSQQDL